MTSTPLSLNTTQSAAPLLGQVALVTGGARGLGAAISRELARAGASVAIADLRQELAAETARAIGDERWAGKAQAFGADISEEAGALDTMERVCEALGPIDILINNAGTDLTVAVEDMTVEEWDRILATNLRAPFMLSRLAFQRMDGRGGQIVNIVSTAAKRAWANASAYHASKWGLLGLSHALHVEGRERNIRVTAVIAGGMRTPFLLDRFPELDPAVLQDPANVAEMVRFVLTMPAGSVVPEVTVLPTRETSWP